MAATCVPRITKVDFLLKEFRGRSGSLLSFSLGSDRRHFSFRQNVDTSISQTIHPIACQRCQFSRFTSGIMTHPAMRHSSFLSLRTTQHSGSSIGLLNGPSIIKIARFYSQSDAAVSQGHMTEVHRSNVLDPYKLVETEMSSLATDIRKILDTKEQLLGSMSHHLFDGKGKSFRPLVALLMSQACNAHRSNAKFGRLQGTDMDLLTSQRIVAMVVEMIHVASLVHDDVIDASETRRGGPSLNKMYGQRLSILTGDYIMSQASIAISRTGNPRVIIILSTIMEDLVNGEFMQLGSKEAESERFAHYLKKTYKKTASLIANTCQSVSILADCEGSIEDSAFQYGKNLGIAFQLVDDMLDFTSTENTMGKPTAADLNLGLATAPVLFAAQEHPELHAMIMRRFSGDGDVEYARKKVAESDGVEKTILLARQHSKAAISSLQEFSPSPAKDALVTLANMLLERKK